MLFPEELDNKPFRLFVQRTWHAMQKHLTMTPSEAEIARLIADHPEVGLFFPGQDIDVSKQYAIEDYNPFLFLAALREINQQILKDRPAGIQQLFVQLLSARLSESEARSRMASAYLELYQKERQSNNHSIEAYLLSMQEFLGDPRYFEDPMAFMPRTSDDPVTSQYMGDIFDKAYIALKAQLYDEISSVALSVDMKLATILERLPREWVQETAKFWRLPRRRLKRDNIRDICLSFSKEDKIKELQGILSAEEKVCLTYVLEHKEAVDYADLIKRFGDEKGDDYWWSKHPPTSVIGQLRLKGLLFIGHNKIAGQNQKIALVPTDLQPLLRKLS